MSDVAATTSDHEVICWKIDMGKDCETQESLETFRWKIGDLIKDEKKLKEAEVYWKTLINALTIQERGAG